MFSKLKERAAILNATRLIKNNNEINKMYRKTNQLLLPLRKPRTDRGDQVGVEGYDIYPSFHLPGKKIYDDISSLVDYIIEQKTVIIDGYAGVFWEKIKGELQRAFPQG